MSLKEAKFLGKLQIPNAGEFNVELTYSIKTQEEYELAKTDSLKKIITYQRDIIDVLVKN